MKEELSIKPNKARLIMRLVFALVSLFVFISILIIAYNPTYSQLLSNELKLALAYAGLPAAYLGLPICLLFITRAIIIGLRKQGLIIIDSKGITDNSTIFGPLLVKWGEIKEVKLINYLTQKLIGVILKNEKEVLSKVSKVKRVLMIINLKTVKTKVDDKSVGVPITLPVRMLNKPVDEVLKLINSHLRK